MKCGTSVYVYTLSADGTVIERAGIVNRRTDNSLIVTVYGGQHIILSRLAGEIRNNAMWSKTPQKNAYIQKMTEILLERRESYREQLEAITRRITNIRQCAG